MNKFEWLSKIVSYLVSPLIFIGFVLSRFLVLLISPKILTVKDKIKKTVSQYEGSVVRSEMSLERSKKTVSQYEGSVVRSEMSLERSKKLFVVNCWLFETCVHAVSLYHKAQMIERFFKNHLFDGKTLEYFCGYILQLANEIEESEGLLYLLSYEFDRRYDKEYFEQYGIVWADRPHLCFYGGGWMHFMNHFTRRVSELKSAILALRDGDVIEGDYSAMLKRMLKRSKLKNGKTVFIQFGMEFGDVTSVDYEMGTLIDMYNYLYRSVRELHELAPNFFTSYLKVNNVLEKFMTKTSLKDIDLGENFTFQWVQKILTPMTSKKDESSEFKHFIRICEDLGVPLYTNDFEPYYKLWPFRHILWYEGQNDK
jgi:hypothetical protein